MARNKARKKSSSALAPRRATSFARVGGSRTRRAARSVGRSADVWAPLIAAAGLGLLEREGVSIPHFGAIGEAGTIAVVGFVALQTGIIPANLRPLVGAAVVSAGSIAAYELAKTLGADKAKTQGDDVDGDEFDAHNT